LNVHVQLGRFHPFFKEPDQCHTCDEHGLLLEALCRQDAGVAVQASELHLQKTEIRIFGFRDTPPYLFAGSKRA
jgi:DNA-binding GntR family transcriptional regulator